MRNNRCVSPAILLVTCAIGIPVAALVIGKRAAARASIGVAPAPSAVFFRDGAAVTWGGRFFDPNLYQLVIAPGTLGFTTYRTPWGRYLYPTIWLTPDMATVSSEQVNVASKMTKRQAGFRCRFQLKGQDQLLDFRPHRPSEALTAMREAGFEVRG